MASSFGQKPDRSSQRGRRSGRRPRARTAPEPLRPPNATDFKSRREPCIIIARYWTIDCVSTRKPAVQKQKSVDCLPSKLANRNTGSCFYIWQRRGNGWPRLTRTGNSWTCLSGGRTGPHHQPSPGAVTERPSLSWTSKPIQARPKNGVDLTNCACRAAVDTIRTIRADVK